ncbi:PRTRC system ThiF family protein [Shewanella algicola]|uniref:PRTRC system ThiF family protein n=1 Tax=Shewanella algicola TaxID=640633 RepID=UPI0024947388|nr:PRTRC system ThiF family protein [Shewanella algicola]
MDFYIPQHLLNKPLNVLLIGAGGSGSQIATELFQMDSLLRQISQDSVCINLTIADGDTVSLFNVGRQAFYRQDIASNKAQVLVSRFNNFGGTAWTSIPEYCDPKTIQFKKYDFIITAVDKAEFRVKLGEVFNASQQSSDLLWIDVGNGVSDGQIICGHAYRKIMSTGIRLPNVYDLYSEMLKQVDDNSEDIPSCSTAAALAKQDFGSNRAVAGQATQLIWQLVRHAKISHHGAFVDVANATVQPLKIDPQIWAVYGYEAQL